MFLRVRRILAWFYCPTGKQIILSLRHRGKGQSAVDAQHRACTTSGRTPMSERDRRFNLKPVVESGGAWVDEVHSYLVQRGLAAEREDHSVLLKKLLEMASAPRTTGLTVNAAAKNLYVSRRTLGRWCQAAGIPQPNSVIRMGRVLNVLELVCKSKCSVHAATRVTNWSDAYSLSNAMVRLTGIRPSAARAIGTLNVVEQWLRRELAAGRAALRTPSCEQIPCPTCGRDIAARNGDPKRPLVEESPLVDHRLIA